MAQLTSSAVALLSSTIDEQEVLCLKKSILEKAKASHCSSGVFKATKECARQYAKEMTSNCISSSYHLDYVGIPACDIEWKRSDQRVSRETMVMKVQANSKQQCVTLEWKASLDSNEEVRVICQFGNVMGLQVNQQAMSVDMCSKPEIFKKVTPSGEAEQATSTWVLQKDGHNQSIQVSHVELKFNRRADTTTLKQSLSTIPCLQRALESGIQDVYQGFIANSDEKAEHHYPILKDPALVHAVQLVYEDLKNDEMCQNIDYLVKLYAGIEAAFNSLLNSRRSIRPHEE